MILTEEDEQTIFPSKMIYDKHNITVTRFKKGSYRIVMDMENSHFCLYTLVDLKMLPFFGELNKTFFEKIEVEHVKENKSKIFMLVHDFFRHFRIYQKYLHLLGEKSENLTLTSKSFSVQNLPPKIKSFNKISQLKLESFQFQVDKTIPHSIHVDTCMSFEIPFPLPLFVEKMAIRLILRVVKFTKRYFESLDSIPQV